MTLTELAEFGFKTYPTDTLAGRQGPPTWLIATDKGVVVVVTEFGDDAQKDLVSFQITRLLRELQASSYVLFSEAWSVDNLRHKEGQTDAELMAETGAPSQHPQRQEIIMASGSDDRGNQIVWTPRLSCGTANR